MKPPCLLRESSTPSTLPHAVRSAAAGYKRVVPVSDAATDAAIAAKWPDAWMKANDPARRNRSKARQQIRQRYAHAMAFEVFVAANPQARCANCDNAGSRHFETRPICELDSDFHGYQPVDPDHRCARWRAKPLPGDPA